MAEYIESSKLHIPGIGHVYLANVGTGMFDISKFKFGDDTTHTGWTWLGDAAQDSPISFESEGGEQETLGTWDRPQARTKNTAGSMSGSITLNGLKKETVLVAFPGSEWNETNKSYKINTNDASERAMAVVTEDGKDVAALALARVSLKGELPSFDREGFLSWVINFTVLDSTQTNIPKIEWFEPRPMTPAAAASSGPRG